LPVYGYANVFETYDHHNDLVAHGAFEESLKRHKNNNTMPAMLAEHQFAVEGRWTAFKEDQFGLWVEGEIDKDDPLCEKVVQRVVKGLSIGFYLQDGFEKKIIMNGKNMSIRYITKVDLVEVSLVASPANVYSTVIPRNVNHYNHNHSRA